MASHTPGERPSRREPNVVAATYLMKWLRPLLLYAKMSKLIPEISMILYKYFVRPIM